MGGDGLTAKSTGAHRSADPRRPLTAIVLALQMLGAYPFTVLPVFAHQLQQHFSLTESALGFLLGCSVMGSLVSLLLVGPATGRLGARRVLQVCFAGLGVGMLAMGMGRSLAAFEAGLLLVGFFGAAAGVMSSTYLIALYPHLKRRMLTVGLISIALPGMVFPLLAERLLRMAERPEIPFADVLHVPFLALGTALVVLQCGLSLVAHRNGHAATEQREPFELRSVLGMPALLVIALAALHAGSDNAIWQWMPKYMDSSFEHLVIGTGTMLALVSGVYFFSRVVLASLPEGIGQRALLVLPGLVGGSVLLAVIWLGGPLAVGLGYPLAALLYSLEYPALLAEVRSTSATRFSTIYAAAVWVSSLVNLLEVNLIGHIGERTGDLRIGLTVGAAGFVAFGLLALISGLGRRNMAPEG